MGKDCARAWFVPFWLILWCDVIQNVIDKPRETKCPTEVADTEPFPKSKTNILFGDAKNRVNCLSAAR
jgi:hypothetical protein